MFFDDVDVLDEILAEANRTYPAEPARVRYARPRITGMWTRPAEFLAPVWVRREDGARIHAGGLVSLPGCRAWNPCHTDPEGAALVAKIETKRRRRWMLYMDLNHPVTS